MNNLNIQPRTPDENLLNLRKVNLVPGVIFGPNLQSTPIKASRLEIINSLSEKGEVYTVKKGAKKYNIKFDEVQRNPVSNEIIHFSLLELPKGENELDIPIALKGESTGDQSGGVIMTMKETITVSGLLKNLPKEITVDITKLDIGDNLKIKDLNVKGEFEILDDENEVLVTCQPPKMSKLETLSEEEGQTEPQLVGEQETS